MTRRSAGETMRSVLTSAAEEARRRGDRRVGTEHLLLGLLHEPDSKAARALGVSLEDARLASDALDLAYSRPSVWGSEPSAGNPRLRQPGVCSRSARARARWSSAPSTRPTLAGRVGSTRGTSSRPCCRSTGPIQRPSSSMPSLSTLRWCAIVSPARPPDTAVRASGWRCCRTAPCAPGRGGRGRLSTLRAR